MARFYRSILAALVALPLLTLAPALGVHAVAPPARAHASASVVHVTIQNFAFGPKTLTVAPGTRVVWTNRDSAAHSVSSDAGLFTSATLDTGKSFSYTFARTGTYAYHCGLHPYMLATIVVKG